MRTSVKFAVVSALVALPLLLGGCYLNVFQTAKTLDQGRVLLGFGAGMVSVPLDEDNPTIFVTPQAQLGIGLADGLQLTLQSGATAVFGDEPGFQYAGTWGELKFRLFDEPEAFALAMGLGGGWGLNYFGWGIHGTLYFDSNAFLPVYIVWRPFLSFGGADEPEIGFGQQFAGGLRLTLSESATLLLEVDYQLPWNLLSPGISLLLSF